jgi:hypothetical protein
MSRVYQWLNAGQHRFTSVWLDSLTEIQKRCLDGITGTSQPTQQDWGQLLSSMEGLVRSMRDLTLHEANPLQVVGVLALAEPDKKGAVRPFIKGQLGLSLPGYVDVVGYLYTAMDEAGQIRRQLLIQPAPGYVAKDRTHILSQAYGSVITDPNIAEMLGVLEKGTI